MNFVTKLNEIQAEMLASYGKVTNGSYLKLVSEFKSSVRFYLEENTGFDLNPISGLLRSSGSDDGPNLSDSLLESLDLHEGDYLLEFNFPSDFLAVIDKENFELLNSVGAKISNNVISDVLIIDKPIEFKDSIAFAPCLFLRFCAGFCQIEDGWDPSNFRLKSVEDFVSIKNF